MITIDELIIPPDSKIIDAIDAINRTGKQIVFVCDSNRRLLGTVTDGDVRRGILNRISLEASVEKIMNSKPVFVRIGTEPKVIQKLMVKHHVNHIPILSEDNILVAIDLEGDGEDRLDGVSVVLMAGGKGQRLYPLTKDVPKPMLKVGEKPILELIIDDLRAKGVRRFFISINYKGDVIKDYFGNGSSKDIEVNYLEEDRPLGTAGSLSLLPQALTEPFIVMNGDVVTRVDFRRLMDFHGRQGAVATMCLKSYEMDVPYGVVSLDGFKLSRIDEKPTQQFFVNAGIYAFDHSMLKHLAKNEQLDMPELFMKLKSFGAKVVGFPLHEYWVDVGRPADLATVEPK
jgi:dTDP-glucose pyrophosphorylase